MQDFDEEVKYNFIFNQIVENEDDFVGCMAYVLYKRNKIEYIENYKKEHGGKEPELKELREWQKSECTERKLKNYRKLAEDLVNNFVNKLQGKKERELKELKTTLDEKGRNLKKCEKEINNRQKYCHVKSSSGLIQFLLGIFQSLIASILFVVLGYCFILYLNRNTDILKTLFDWQKSTIETEKRE